MAFFFFVSVFALCVVFFAAPAWAGYKPGTINKEFDELCAHGTAQQVRDAMEAGAEWGDSALMLAVSQSTPEIVKLLLDAGIDEEKYKGDNNLLWSAVTSITSEAEVVRLLLDVGLYADINAKDDLQEGWTALIKAVNCPCKPDTDTADIIDLLLKAGADVDARDNWGQTALISVWSFATGRKGVTETIPALIKAGTDVNAKDDAGYTALMMAAIRSGFPLDAINALLEAGADVNAKNSSGETALLLAAKFNKNNSGVITALAKAGADVNVRDKEGKTALILAAEYNPYAIDVLLEAGADVNLKDNEGRRAIDYVEEENPLIQLREIICGVARLEELSAREVLG